MTSHTAKGNLTKLQRHRARRSAQGLKLLRVWVPNPQSPGFAKEAHRQALLMRGAAEETEALDFIEATFDSRA